MCKQMTSTGGYSAKQCRPLVQEMVAAYQEREKEKDAEKKAKAKERQQKKAAEASGGDLLVVRGSHMWL